MVGRGWPEKGGTAIKANVRRGDIYFVVGGAAVGSEQTANRPAVIVSNNVGNRYAPIVEVVYLTTRTKAGLPTHVFIGSARKPSIALCEQIVTVSKGRLERRIGRVTVEEMSNIDKALEKSLGIHRAGGNAVQVTMKTPFGEMNFDMQPDKAADLMQRAFQYAAEKETVKETKEIFVPQLKAGFPPATDPSTVTEVATEGPEMVVRPEPPKKQSRVERMFGDFRATNSKAEQTVVPSDGHINFRPDLPAQPQSYKGFLLVKCEECGKLRGFCAKLPAASSRCECGHRTELHDLKPAFLKCKCGSQFKYKTNVTEEIFDYPCLKCGNPVDLQLNKRGDAYVTIGE